MSEPVQSNFDAALSLGWHMSRTGRSRDALALLPDLLSAARLQRDDRAYARLLTQSAWLCLQLGQCDPGLEFVVRAQEIWRGLSDPEGEAFAHCVCSWLLIELGLIDEGFAEAEAAVAGAEQTSNTRLLAFAYNCKATALALCRQDGLGLPLFEQALALTDTETDPSAAALYLINIAFSYTSKAELAEAGGAMEEGEVLRRLCMDFARRAIAMAEACDDLWVLRLSLCNGAEYAANLGWFDVAQDYLDRCEQLPGFVGFRERIHFLYTKGDVLTRLGSLSEALPICVEAAGLAAKNSHADIRSATLRRLADAEAALGLFQQSLEHFRAYHEAYVWQMGEMTRRRAILAEVQNEARRLRREAEGYAHQATHDALTGLRNRRKFEEDFEELQGTGFVLGILDLDRFKSINDRHTHLVGDAVLRRLASLLEAEGSAWRAYRLGGEEFALLFPQCTVKPARAAAEALRKAIARTEWSDLGAGLRVTVSIGLAEGGDMPRIEVMSLADKRLYRAKTSGRNRVVAAVMPEPDRLSA